MTSASLTRSQLDREARLRRPFVAIAVLCALLLIGASILQMSGPHTKVDEATLDLIAASKRSGLDIGAGVLTALGSVAIAATLVFLADAARARNPQIAPFLRIMAIVGAALAAISGVVYAIQISHIAHQFATTGSQTYPEAHRLESGGGLLALQIAGLLGALLVAMSLALISMQAMRVGLLTRFMGYLGMISGALVIFQITPVPVVEAYWFLALAVLFAGRWPTGEPLAWRTGRAERWPSAHELREQRIRERGGADAKAQRGSESKGARAGGSAKPAKSPPGEVVTAGRAAAGREGAKRKRKRRR
jgi:hypothetical protein